MDHIALTFALTSASALIVATIATIVGLALSAGKADSVLDCGRRLILGLPVNRTYTAAQLDDLLQVMQYQRRVRMSAHQRAVKAALSAWESGLAEHTGLRPARLAHADFDAATQPGV